MIDFYEQGSKTFPWWQDWRGECVAIVASGPSAKTAGVEKLRDRIHVVAVNESYQLCPWAEILYSCDIEWWRLREIEVDKKFSGLKITLNDPERPTKMPNKISIPKHCQIWVNDLLLEKPGVIGSGGNSGFQVINLVAQFGAAGIGLVGFDMQANGHTHWHGLHPVPLRNPDNARFWQWKKELEIAAPKLAAQGIDVVNCSMQSALTAFPKMTVDEMLERWGL